MNVKIITIVIMVSLLVGCKTNTVYVPVKQSSVETVILHDTIIKTNLIHYRDTIVTNDSLSFLSNPYAYSWVELKGGRMHHSLTIWPDSLIPIKLRYLERIRVDSISVPCIVEKPVLIEKNYSWWMKIRLRLGEVFILFFLIGIALFFYKKK